MAWVSLDGERLTHPAFWTLVLESMQVALPDERPFRLPGSTDSALVAFMNRIAAQPRPVVLVLDDFHVVSDPGVMADLDVLLEHPLDALRLVILSRRDPPLRLVRLRVAGHMDELRARDLAFTEAEAGAFFRETVPALSERDAGALLRCTEGWAAGLRMAVLTLRGHPDPRGFVTDFAGTDSAVADYLLTEVLDHQTDCERTFLLRISLTDAVCGELADVLSGRGGCARQLQRLAGENAMLERVEGRPGWFRFHPLMRDLLRAELHAVAASELAGMHVAAARWFAERGWVRPATRHALAAGERTLAASVVAGGWIELFLEGGAATLRSLVDLLPAEAIAAEPELSLATAAAYIEDGQEVEAATAMRTALDGLDRVAPERRDQFRVAYAVVALRTARLHGDIAEGLQTARRMIGDELPRVAAPGLHAIALATVGIAELWTGESARAAAHLETALGESERSGHRYVAALALAHLACMDSLQGRILRADRRARAAVAIVERYGWTRTSAAAAAYGVRSGIEFLWDDLEGPRARSRTPPTRSTPLRSVHCAPHRRQPRARARRARRPRGRAGEPALRAAAARGLRAPPAQRHPACAGGAPARPARRARRGARGAARSARGAADAGAGRGARAPAAHRRRARAGARAGRAVHRRADAERIAVHARAGARRRGAGLRRAARPRRRGRRPARGAGPRRAARAAPDAERARPGAAARGPPRAAPRDRPPRVRRRAAGGARRQRTAAPARAARSSR